MNTNFTQEQCAKSGRMAESGTNLIRKLTVTGFALTTLLAFNSPVLASGLSRATVSHSKTAASQTVQLLAQSTPTAQPEQGTPTAQPEASPDQSPEDSAQIDPDQVQQRDSLKIQFDDGSTVANQEAESLIQNAPEVQNVPKDSVPEDSTQTEQEAEPTRAPYSYKLSCRVDRVTFVRRYGTIGLRHNCRFRNVNWDFKIARKLRAIATSPVSELGARWWKNDAPQSANAPHLEPADYHFHGTFPKVSNNDRIAYYDVYRFRVNVAGRPGVAILQVGGTFRAVP